MNIRKGKYYELALDFYNKKTKAQYTDLSSATEIKFQLKDNKADTTAILSKKLTTAGIVVSTTVTYRAIVYIQSTDIASAVAAGDKYVAAEVTANGKPVDVEIRENGILLDTIYLDENLIV